MNNLSLTVRRLLTRSVRTGLVVVSAALVLSGCGSDAGSGDAGSSSSKASPSTSSEGSSKVLNRTDLFDRLVAAQKKAGSYTFTLDVGLGPSQALTGTGEADTSTTPASVRLTETLAGQQIETITADGVIYLKSATIGGGKYVKIDPKTNPSFGALGAGDPSNSLKVLQSAATVRRGSSSTINGVSTTEYDVTVPSSALGKSSAVAQQLLSSLPKTVSYELFVDKDDQLRRLLLSLPFQGRTVQTKIDFADYGKKVDVTAPPAAQVTTAPPALGG